MAPTIMMPFMLLLLLSASIVPGSTARIGRPSPSIHLTSSGLTDQNHHGEPKAASVFDYVRHLFWNRQDTGDIAVRQVTTAVTVIDTVVQTISDTVVAPIIAPSLAQVADPSGLTVTLTSIILESTTIYSSTVTVPAPPASLSTPLSVSSTTSTLTETINGVVTIITTIIVSTESAIGTSNPSSASSVTSQAITTPFICTEAICTPTSTAFSWTCSDTTSCLFSTTLASYSCSSGNTCSLTPVTTTWSCPVPTIGNICTTLVPFVPILSIGSSSSAAASLTPSVPAPVIFTTAAPGTQCSDGSCCPAGWDCNPTSTIAATVFDLLACPVPLTGTWDIACVPLSWSSFITETNFLVEPFACPPYKTCVFPSTQGVTTVGTPLGSTSTGSITGLEDLCANQVAVCTSTFPSMTQLSQGSCLVGDIYPPLCDRCSSMRIPDDCPKTVNVPWPTTGSYFYCACSIDVTGLSLGSGTAPSGAGTTCANWKSVSTTEVVGSTTITTMVNPYWDTCEQPDVKTDCGTAASCTSIVSYTAQSSQITIIEGGVTIKTWIFWWGCQSDLCNASWWGNLINGFCRLIGICHPPDVSGDGFPRPPWPEFPPQPDPLSFTSPNPTATNPSGSSSGSPSDSSSGSASSSSSSCSAVTVTDLIVYCFNTTISGGVFTTGCSTTSSFTTTGCSLTPITTTTTDSATCSVVTVTDVGVGCFNITDSTGGFTATCNQTSTFLSTGCSLTPTSSTTTEDAPACSLSPNYDDPAILSDLSSWLLQFPLTLPPDTVNITSLTTTPNATLPPSTTPAGWTTVELITTVVTGTDPTAVQTEVVSESVDLWGGVTTIISGSITDYISATSSSTLAGVTISTITPVPTAVTTTRITTSTDSAGESVIVSEVDIIYGIQSTVPLGTSTSVLVDSLVSTLTISPSDLSAAITTNSFGEVESDEIGISGTKTVTVSQVIISTVSSIANSLFGTPDPAAPSATAAASTSIFCVAPASISTSTTCDIIAPAAPTKAPKDQFLNCAFDTDPAKVDYNTVNYNVPINGRYWLNPKTLWPRRKPAPDPPAQDDPTYEMCFRMFGPESPFVIGPAGGKNPGSSLIYTNSLRVAFPNLGNVIGYGNSSLDRVPFLTYSVTYDTAACYTGLPPGPVLLHDVSVVECYNSFQMMSECHSQANPNQMNGDYIPTTGGSFWSGCLVWSVWAQEDYACSCPWQVLEDRVFSPTTALPFFVPITGEVEARLETSLP